MIYETGTLNPSQITAFTQKFHKEIGTEFERNKDYVICLEMTPKEVEKCREIEAEITTK